jgi:hypothetical protein
MSVDICLESKDHGAFRQHCGFHERQTQTNKNLIYFGDYRCLFQSAESKCGNGGATWRSLHFLVRVFPFSSYLTEFVAFVQTSYVLMMNG